MGEKTDKECLMMTESTKIIECKSKKDSSKNSVEIELFPRTRSFGYFTLKKLTESFVDVAGQINHEIISSENLPIDSVAILYETKMVSKPIFAFISVPDPKPDGKTIPKKKVGVIDFKVTLVNVDQKFLHQIINIVSRELHKLNSLNEFYFRNVNKCVSMEMINMTPATPLPEVPEDTIRPEI